MAAKCGDRLVARAQKVEGGLGWFTNVETVKPITGFAHGAAGISWALLELAARTGNTNYRDTALKAILYEHSQFSSAAGNWAENAPGSETAGKETGPSMAWCYGAPGIGLARVAAMKHIDHPVVRKDLQRDSSYIQLRFRRQPLTVPWRSRQPGFSASGFRSYR
jgi:lantibiotic modifying enzyme